MLFKEGHPVSPARRGDGCFHARWAAADNYDLLETCRSLQFVPALLPGPGVHQAGNRLKREDMVEAALIAGHTANDLVKAALSGLARQFWVCY